MNNHKKERMKSIKLLILWIKIIQSEEFKTKKNDKDYNINNINTITFQEDEYDNLISINNIFKWKIKRQKYTLILLLFNWYQIPQ